MFRLLIRCLEAASKRAYPVGRGALELTSAASEALSDVAKASISLLASVQGGGGPKPFSAT